jgi:hypothetical protein
MVFFADALFNPLDGTVVIAGESLDPLIVLGGALAQDFLGNGANPVHVAKEVQRFSAETFQTISTELSSQTEQGW